MQQIKDAGFTVIPMQDFLAWRRGDKDIPPKSCRHHHRRRLRVRLRHRLAYPEEVRLSVHDVRLHQLHQLGRQVGFTWDQLAEMRDAGVDIEIATPTRTATCAIPTTPSLVDAHTFKTDPGTTCKTLGMDGWMHKEIAGFQAGPRKQLGIKVNCLAYPFGKYDAEGPRTGQGGWLRSGFHRVRSASQLQRAALRPAGPLRRGDATNPKIFQDALTMTGGRRRAVPFPWSTPAMAQLAAASA